ncbi:hypothetical protein B0H67DRAFT_646174 [Lasiosphaeris hirsuta]|uniref:NB-ARC domain-containing protein n=1 Tax=Lasiosphaeris hirsuta TaxID=260670 RepID=A0AA40A7U8_9PEZI|nr:hypothetical protein B0H67DRAFT_646174 [Lasiosphaeris hirsuta]
MGSSVDTAPRLYHKIFFPKNDQFVGKSDVLKTMHSSLDHSGHDKHHRAAVLWGTGGIGKTQIATAYAHDRKEAGVPLILWINSETRLNLYQDFTDIALGLGLGGAVAGNHAANLFLVQKWLEKTTLTLVDYALATNWLLIFDNVVDYGLVSESWPLGAMGSALLTSRPEICDHLLRSIEVPKFDSNTGRDLILATVSRDCYAATE